MAECGVAGSLAVMARTLGEVSAASLLTLLFDTLERAAMLAGKLPASAFLYRFTGSFSAAAALAALVPPASFRRICR